MGFPDGVELPGLELTSRGLAPPAPPRLAHPLFSRRYQLHCECSKWINLHDLLESFSAIVTPRAKKPDTAVQARFLRAVAELQHLGYIKPTKRKADHVQRLTAAR